MSDSQATIIEALTAANSAHGTWGFNGTETACRCDRMWRDAVEHRKHLAEAQAEMLAPLIKEAQAQMLLHVARTLTVKECADANRTSRNSPRYTGSIEEPFAILLQRRAVLLTTASM